MKNKQRNIKQNILVNGKIQWDNYKLYISDKYLYLSSYNEIPPVFTESELNEYTTLNNITIPNDLFNYLTMVSRGMYILGRPTYTDIKIVKTCDKSVFCFNKEYNIGDEYISNDKQSDLELEKCGFISISDITICCDFRENYIYIGEGDNYGSIWAGSSNPEYDINWKIKKIENTFKDYIINSFIDDRLKYKNESRYKPLLDNYKLC